MTISPVGPDNHASLSSPWEQQEKASCSACFPSMVHKGWLIHPFPSCVYFHKDSWWIFENVGIVEWCSQSWLFFRFQTICHEDDHRNNIEMVLCSVAAITNDHKTGGLKQHTCILWQSWGSEFQNQSQWASDRSGNAVGNPACLFQILVALDCRALWMHCSIPCLHLQIPSLGLQSHSHLPHKTISHWI